MSCLGSACPHAHHVSCTAPGLRELREVGYAAKTLRKVGYALHELVEGGFSASGLKHAGYVAEELKEVNLSYKCR